MKWINANEEKPPLHKVVLVLTETFNDPLLLSWDGSVWMDEESGSEWENEEISHWTEIKLPKPQFNLNEVGIVMLVKS